MNYSDIHQQQEVSRQPEQRAQQPQSGLQNLAALATIGMFVLTILKD
jgi:hypothetical protein